MNILDTIINAQDGAAVRQLGSSSAWALNRRPRRSRRWCRRWPPGCSRNVESGRLGSAAQALASGQHRRTSTIPVRGAALDDADGNNILGHLLGSKDASRASRRTRRRRPAEPGRPQTDAADRGGNADGCRGAHSAAAVGPLGAPAPSGSRRVADAAARSATATARWWTT